MSMLLRALRWSRLFVSTPSSGSGSGPAVPASDAPRSPQQVDRNIATIVQMEQTARERRSAADRWSGAIGGFAGSVTFIVVQALFFAAWILANGPSSGIRFDPYPHNWLMLILGFEAIVVSAFVLISQQHMQARAERRAHLNLQFNLLVEAEMTKMLNMLQTLREDLGVPGTSVDEELRDLAARTEVAQVVQALDLQLDSPPATAPDT